MHKEDDFEYQEMEFGGNQLKTISIMVYLYIQSKPGLTIAAAAIGCMAYIEKGILTYRYQYMT